MVNQQDLFSSRNNESKAGSKLEVSRFVGWMGTQNLATVTSLCVPNQSIGMDVKAKALALVKCVLKIDYETIMSHNSQKTIFGTVILAQFSVSDNL